MRHLGDFDTLAVVYDKFSTFRPSTGAAYTLAGSPALSVYKDGSTTQTTTGVTLMVDFDSTTGLHHYAIDTSADGTFYSAGSFFQVVVTAGTVDGISIVGAVVGSFTLRKSSALKPTTAGRSLDVSSGGEAGVDWANIGSPTTANDLSGTSTKALEPTTAGRKLDVSAGGEAGLDWANVGSPTTTNNLSGTTVKAVTDDVGITQAGADKSWSTTNRSLTTFGTLIADIWANVSRTLSDKTGFALTSAYDAAKTAGDATAANQTTINNNILALPAAVWAAGGRTLTSFGTLVSDVAAAVWAYGSRVLTAFGFSVAVSDKTGFSLDSSYDPAKTAAQAGDAMALTVDYDAAKTAAQPGDAMTLDSTYDAAKTAAQPGDIPTLEAIALSILARKITYDSGAGEYVIWDAAGTGEIARLTPTVDAAALPIIGMEPV